MKEKLKEQTREYLDFLSESPCFEHCGYFKQVALDYIDCAFDGRKLVGVTSMYFPELFIRACGATPVYLPGGYAETCTEVEEIFPQISDKVSKSVMNLLIAEDLDFSKKLSGVIVTVSNDSNTKLSYYLRQKGFNVINVDKSPFLLNNITRDFVLRQRKILMELMKLSKRPITKRRLIDNARTISKSHDLFKQLDDSVLETRLTVFIKETYYLTKDIERWQMEVELLLMSLPKSRTNRKSVLIVGGEIQFPNHKVTSILEETNIKFYYSDCCVPYPYDYSGLNEKLPLPLLLKQLYKIHYKNMYRQEMLSEQEINFENKTDAVIFHQLKGQLLSAYHADKVEKNCITKNIPYIGIETDYTKADKEQIKIRIEAFTELLNARTKGKGAENEKKVA